MTMSLDDFIGLAAARPTAPEEVAAIDQAECAVRDAATEAGVDLADPVSARAVTFGAHCPMFIAAAAGTPRGAVLLARHVTAATAARSQESTT